MVSCKYFDSAPLQSLGELSIDQKIATKPENSAKNSNATTPLKNIAY